MSFTNVAGISVSALLADIGTLPQCIAGGDASGAAADFIHQNLSKLPDSLQRVGDTNLVELVSTWQVLKSVEAQVLRDAFSISAGDVSAPEPLPILYSMIASAHRETYREKRVSAVPLENLEPPVSVVAGQILQDYAIAVDSLKKAFSGLNPSVGEFRMLDHLDSLMMNHTASLPWSGRSGTISMYDACRSAAAIAGALYSYRMDAKSDSSPEEKPLLFVTGDFIGIQNFIFEGGGITQQRLARLLRGRSFMVGMLMELAGLLLVELSALTPLQILHSVAGKLTIVGPNTQGMKRAVAEAEQIVNEWLLERFYGQVSIALSSTEASIDDVKAGNYPLFKKRVAHSLEHKKLQRFSRADYGVKAGLLDSIERHGVCPFCNRRAATDELHEETLKGCRPCIDQIMLGRDLPRRDVVSVYRRGEAAGDVTEPVFGRYQVALEESLSQTAVSSFRLSPGNAPFRLIGGSIPVVDSKIRKRLEEAGFADSEEKGERLYDGQAIPFAQLAQLSRTQKGTGLLALGVLKADVDRLGQLFEAAGTSLSAEKALSRQVHHFFAVYLEKKLSEQYPLLYTVFAGGDDLFLIGPWTDVLQFARSLPEYLADYSCENSAVTISVGYTIHDAGTPVVQLASESEHALEMAKETRNSVCLFGVRASPGDLIQLEERRKRYCAWREKNEDVINSAMLYRWLAFADDAAQDRRIGSGTGVRIGVEEMRALKWRSHLRYTLARNVKDEGLRNEILQLSDDLEAFDERLRIPLSEMIYRNRKG